MQEGQCGQLPRAIEKYVFKVRRIVVVVVERICSRSLTRAGVVTAVRAKMRATD
jgi:hypothetical protein